MSSAGAGTPVTVQEARNPVPVDCNMSSGVDMAVAGSADYNKISDTSRYAVVRAVKTGDVQLATRLLLDGPRTCPDMLNAQEDGTGTALFWAAVRGYHEMVELLLILGACVITTTRWLATPLHGAADNGHVTVVRNLLHRGADANAQTEQKDTACHLAAYRGHTGVVRELLIGGTNVWLKNCRSLDVMGEAEANKQTAVHIFLRRFITDQLLEKNTPCSVAYDIHPSSKPRQHCVQFHH